METRTPSSKPPSRTFTAKLIRDEEGGSRVMGIELPFDPKEVFGKVRAPVTVTFQNASKHSYRSTVCNMGGLFIPFRKSNQEAAGITSQSTAKVTVTLDTAPRVVVAPKDLRSAVEKAKLLEVWKVLSYTNQREHVEAIEQAKKPETRTRRIEKCVEMLAGRAKK